MKKEPTPERYDIFHDVRPSGWLAEMLRRVGSPRKFRWNAYYRACRQIPKDSPVAGVFSWKRINERRARLIELELKATKARPFKRITELEALQNVASAVRGGSLSAHNFLLARLHRRVLRAHPVSS